MLALIVDLGWKSTAVAGVVLLIGMALDKRAAGERVAVLRAGIVALLMLPFAALLLPAIEIAVLPGAHIAAGPFAPDAQATGWTPHDGVLLVYIGVAALLVLRLLIGVAVLHRWTRAAPPVDDAGWARAVARAAAGMRRQVRLRASPKVAAPISWGLSPAWILIPPASLDRDEQAEAVIAHEMAHIRSLDWPMLLAARIAVALFWFNPLVWLLARTLVRQTELAADAAALGRVAPVDYAQALLGAAVPHTRHALVCGMTIERGTLASRIQRVLAGNVARPRRAFSLALAFDVLIAAAVLSMVQLVGMAPPVEAARPAAVAVVPTPPRQVAIAPERPAPRTIARADAPSAPAVRRVRSKPASEAAPRHEEHADQAMQHAVAEPPREWQTRLARVPDSFVDRAGRVAERIARQERRRQEARGKMLARQETRRALTRVKLEHGWAWRPPPSPRPSRPSAPPGPSGPPTTDS